MQKQIPGQKQLFSADHRPGHVIAESKYRGSHWTCDLSVDSYKIHRLPSSHVCPVMLVVDAAESVGMTTSHLVAEDIRATTRISAPTNHIAACFLLWPRRLPLSWRRLLRSEELFASVRGGDDDHSQKRYATYSKREEKNNERRNEQHTGACKKSSRCFLRRKRLCGPLLCGTRKF